MLRDCADNTKGQKNVVPSPEARNSSLESKDLQKGMIQGQRFGTQVRITVMSAFSANNISRPASPRRQPGHVSTALELREACNTSPQPRLWSAFSKGSHSLKGHAQHVFNQPGRFTWSCDDISPRSGQNVERGAL